ncbi:BnaCnng56310D [Brassica napus]|uniref:Uncharacterized protein n=2 Tax=Brassica TaxID=3705 RepID=A0A0D3DI35_BRAOL|nr:unnamed protein product [Brassica napus]CDY67769.1 BnaCnng56310D [Brassica napus]
MCSGAGDAFSRRRGASSTVLVLNTILCFLFHCLLCLLPVRFLWIVGGSRSRRMLRWRRELRLFIVLLSAVLPLRVVLLPAMSREDSLAAALLWSSGSDPVVLPSGCRLSSQAVDLVQIFQPCMELRFQPTHLISSSLRRFESHRPLCSAAPHLTGDRSINTTSSDPSPFSDASTSPPSKVVLFSPLWCLFDGGTIPLRQRSSGDHLYGADEHVDSKLVLILLSASLSPLVWAWPKYGMSFVSPRSNLPRPNCFRRICDPTFYGTWVRASFSESSVSSPGIVLIRSSSSYEEKPLPPYTLHMARGASSDLLSSVCFSFFIVLSSCGAVSTGPEDTSEITLVVLVDGVWTPTSLNVTILELYDVKAFPTHSSIVSNSLSSSLEDLSYLAYLHVCVYAYCKRRWIIPSCSCSEES